MLTESRNAIAKGIGNLCKLYDRDPNPEWFELWNKHLETLPAYGISWAFDQLEKTFIPSMACPFPVPAHIKELLEAPAKLEAEIAAEKAWQRTIDRIAKQYHPDLGWRGDSLEKEIADTVKAAGGVHYLWNASGEQLVWAKKEFITAMTRRTL